MPGMVGLWRLLPGAQTLQAWRGGGGPRMPFARVGGWQHQSISNETLILTLFPFFHLTRHRLSLLHVIYKNSPFSYCHSTRFAAILNHPSIWVFFFNCDVTWRISSGKTIIYIGDSSPKNGHSLIRFLKYNQIDPGQWSHRRQPNFQETPWFFWRFGFFLLQDSLEHWSFSVGFSTTTLAGLYVFGPGRFRVGIQGGNWGLNGWWMSTSTQKIGVCFFFCTLNYPFW